MQPEVKPHPEADRIAAEVAARYGVAVRPGAVAQVPRGASGRPLPVWDGHRLIYPEWDRKKVERAAKVEAARKSRLARLDPHVLARRERVAALHAEGATVAQMAEALSLKEAPIRYDLAQLGLAPNRAKPRDPVEELRSLIARGFTRREDLAAELGWTVSWLCRVAAGAKIVLPGAEPKPRKVSRQIEAMKLARQGRAEVRRETVARLHAEGKTLTEIMAATGAARSSVQRDMRALGLRFAQPPRAPKVRPPRPVRVSPAQDRRARVAQLVAEGLNQTQIRARIGCAIDTLRRDLAALGLRCAAPKPPTWRVALIEALKDPEATRDSLCVALRCSRRDLSRRAAKAGIKLPPVTFGGDPVQARIVRSEHRAGRLAQVAALHAEGYSPAGIAQVLNVTVSCTYEYLRDLGLSKRRVDVRARQARVADLRAQGLTSYQIASQTGDSVGCVCWDLRALGMGEGWQP